MNKSRTHTNRTVSTVLLICILMLISAGISAQETEGEIQDSTQSPADIAEEDLLINNPEQENGEPTEDEALFSIWDFLRMFGILGLVLLAIYLVLRFLKRSGGGKFGNNDLIKIRASQSLGGSRSLHIIQIQNSFLLIGASENGVHKISEIEDQETIDTIRLHGSTSETTLGGSTFRDLLAKVLPGTSHSLQQKKTDFGKTSPDNEQSGSFLEQQKARLDKLR